MRLPDVLQQRPFAEWNYLVKGIVGVWELARSLGFEETLEEHLSRDEEGRLAELLGCLGCALLNLNASHDQSDKSSDHETPIGGYSLLVANALVAFFFVAHVGSRPPEASSQNAQLGGQLSAYWARVLPLHYANGVGILRVGALALHGDQSTGASLLKRVSSRALSRA
jgi:hypothetical protein